ncbi:hypothetical protein LINPERPRIM_LOCUS1740 [Linum perenne]
MVFLRGLGIALGRRCGLTIRLLRALGATLPGFVSKWISPNLFSLSIVCGVG